MGLKEVEEAVSSIDSFFDACGKIGDFFKNCFTNPRFIIEGIQGIAPDVLLITVGILVVLRFLGFKSTTKWMALALSIGAIISVL